MRRAFLLISSSRFWKGRLLQTRCRSKDGQNVGRHIVGEMAGEIAQVAAITISKGMRVEELVLVPFAIPTSIVNFAYAAADASLQLDLQVVWKESGIESSLTSHVLYDTISTTRWCSVPLCVNLSTF